MTSVRCRNVEKEKINIKNIMVFWLSKCILNIITNEQRKLFRALENDKIKKVKAEQHIKFNEQCINNDLLPKFTNIYIYIYIYIYMYIFI